MAESDLYQPIKVFLEGQGYEVKGEVGPCDVVAVRGEEAPVLVELKSQLNLALVLQAVDRLAISDTVYIAFRIGKRKGKNTSASWRTRRKAVVALVRRLGIGLLTVSMRGNVVPVLDPASYRPRPNSFRRERLLKEFHERVGDPEIGGSKSQQRLTAYRQDAILCAQELRRADSAVKVSDLRERTGVLRAGKILLANHYGWFDRVKTGHYELSPKGRRGLEQWVPSKES